MFDFDEDMKREMSAEDLAEDNVTPDEVVTEEFLAEMEREVPETAPLAVEKSEALPAKSEAAAPVPKAEEPKKPFAEALDWANNLIIAASVMFVLGLFFFRSITVSGPSMNDTLRNNDRVITASLFYEPSRGDIVVVQADKLPNGNTHLYGEPIIKRVIAVAGDTLNFDLENSRVYLNGELLEEDYTIGKTNRQARGWVESGKDYKVPENCVFVMGDNRSVSNDSRNLESVGFIDKNNIMGKVYMRLWPISDFKWLG